MSEIQKTETGIAKRIDLDQFKSLYYLLNAKPDSQIRLLKEDKVIAFEDIIELNDKVIEKLKTETLETSITTITVVFKNKKVNTYNNWQEFTRSNWQIADQTMSISLNWDININLPHHELPQRHTLKIRLGSPIRPSEAFQLMMFSDKDDEILEATSNGVCKVDFINTVIANELLSIVDEWYSALPNNQANGWFVRFSEKYRRYFAFTINTIIPLSAILLSYNLVVWKIGKISELSNSDLKDLTFIIAISIAIIYISDLIGKIISSRVFSQLGDYREYSMFRLTKGDNNAIDDVDKKNRKIQGSIITQFVISFITGLICLFLGKII